MKIPLHWHTEPLLLLLVVGACWAHALMCGPLRARCLPGRTEYPIWYAVRFHLGVLVAYVAVGSPLDQLGEAFLFSAHMLQHMLLIYISAPLIVTGLPPEFVDGYLLEGRPRLTRVFRVLTHPLAGGLIFTLFFSIWHFPELYEAALRSRPPAAVSALSPISRRGFRTRSIGREDSEASPVNVAVTSWPAVLCSRTTPSATWTIVR